MVSAMSIFYIPCSNEPEASMISRQLLEEQLIACGNIIGPVRSFFRWEGQIQESMEVILILKTRVECSENLQQRIKELHSYSCPCILELSPHSINQPYLEWIRSVVPWEAPSPKTPIKALKPIPAPTISDRPPWD